MILWYYTTKSMQGRGYALQTHKPNKEIIVTALQIAVLTLLAGLAGYVVFLIRKAIVAKIGQEKYDHLNKIVEDVVRYCEQVGKNLGWEGVDKKALAINLIHTTVEKFGYQVDEELIDILVERAVQVLNEAEFFFPTENYAPED